MSEAIFNFLGLSDVSTGELDAIGQLPPNDPDTLARLCKILGTRRAVALLAFEDARDGGNDLRFVCQQARSTLRACWQT